MYSLHISFGLPGVGSGARIADNSEGNPCQCLHAHNNHVKSVNKNKCNVNELDIDLSIYGINPQKRVDCNP